MDQVPSFLDFEASSLSPQSYPIELAWSLADGSVESHLISPRGIETWTDWDPEAERIHGIPRDLLLAQGQPPSLVCRFANEQLSGKLVYCDAPSFDGMWLAKLFSICRDVYPGFELRHIDDLLVTMICAEVSGRPRAFARIASLKTEARKRKPQRHRAAWDVEYLVQLWQLARAEPGSAGGASGA
jgi:hypothetical protein